MTSSSSRASRAASSASSSSARPRSMLPRNPASTRGRVRRVRELSPSPRRRRRRRGAARLLGPRRALVEVALEHQLLGQRRESGRARRRRLGRDGECLLEGLPCAVRVAARAPVTAKLLAQRRRPCAGVGIGRARTSAARRGRRQRDRSPAHTTMPRVGTSRPHRRRPRPRPGRRHRRRRSKHRSAQGPRRDGRASSRRDRPLVQPSAAAR